MNTKQGNPILACAQFHSCEMFWERKELCKPDYSCQLEYNNLIIVTASKNIFLLRWCLSSTHPLQKMLFWERKSYVNQITYASIWIK